FQRQCTSGRRYMKATQLQWCAVLCAAAMSCGQQQTQASARAPASKLLPKRSANLKGPTRVLVLADQDSDGTTALLSALSGAGYAVTERPPPEYTWDGVTPSANDFDVIVHLNGKTYSNGLPQATQQMLQSWVQAGGGYVSAQWNGLEFTQNTQIDMPELVLQSWGGRNNNNCNNCTMTWTADSTQLDHPVLAGIPQSFAFFAEGHDASPIRAFGAQPSTVLMRAPKGGPAVTVREFGSGHVVMFSVAANYLTGASLQDANIQKLYVNAVAWAAHPVSSGVTADAGPDQVVQAAGTQTPVMLDGSGSTPPDADYQWAEGQTPIAAGVTVGVDLCKGAHTITLTVTDSSGSSASATTSVTVVDSAPPVISTPGNLVAEAAGTAGATVSFSVSANDAVDGSVP